MSWTHNSALHCAFYSIMCVFWKWHCSLIIKPLKTYIFLVKYHRLSIFLWFSLTCLGMERISQEEAVIYENDFSELHENQ